MQEVVSVLFFFNSFASFTFAPSAPPLIEMKAYLCGFALRYLKYARSGVATFPIQTGAKKKNQIIVF